MRATWERPLEAAGEELLGRAHRRRTLLEELAANLPPGRAIRAFEILRRRAKLEALLKRETAEAA